MTLFPPLILPVIYTTKESSTLMEAGLPYEKYCDSLTTRNVVFYEIENIMPYLHEDEFTLIKGACKVLSGGEIFCVMLSPKELVEIIDKHIRTRA
jgi:hypothetical protein